MVNVSVSVPPDMKKKMGERDEVNWSAVARKSFEAKLRAVEALEKFAEKSTLTEEDALELGRKVKAGMARRHGLLK